MTSAAAREILNAPRLLPHRRCYTMISLRCWGGHKGGPSIFWGGPVSTCAPLWTRPWPHNKEFSEDLKKKRIVAPYKDGVEYKKNAKTLKLSCSMVAKTIQQFNGTGSTQSRPRHGRPNKLSARAQHHIQRLCLGNRHMSAASIAAEVEGLGVSLSVLRPYATHCINSVYMSIVPEGSLWWCTRNKV